MKSISLFCVLILSSIIVSGQDTMSTEKYFKRGLITLNDQQLLKVKSVEIAKDSLNFVYLNNGENGRVAIADISEFKIKTGTRVVGGAIIGAAIPFIFLLEALLDSEPNPQNTGLRVLAFVGTGAWIGGAIGYSIPVWESYSLEEHKKVSMSIGYKIKANSRMLGASIVVSF